jgi:hypothetical protein
MSSFGVTRRPVPASAGKQFQILFEAELAYAEGVIIELIKQRGLRVAE